MLGADAATDIPAIGGSDAYLLDSPPGLKRKGNLDPYDRKVLRNADGSVSTTRSFSIGTDEGEVLIPQVVDGKLLSKDQAIARYRQSGENLGVFDSPEHADAYAQALHNDQAEKLFGPRGSTTMSTPPDQLQAPDPNDLPGTQGISVPQPSFNLDSGASPDVGAQPDTRKKIDVGPPNFDPKFDQEAMKTAKTPSDLFNAMHATSQNKYMRWWQQEHGNINQKWDQVVAEIGHRPDPDRTLSRKEKFGMLLDFGLHLMAQSGARPASGQLAGANAAIGSTILDQQASRQSEQDVYDSKLAAAGAGRAADMKTIGTGGQALESQQKIDTGQASEIASEAGAAKDLTPTYSRLQTLTDKDGVVHQQNIDGSWQPVLSAGKKVIQDPNIGPRGGRGRGTSVYQQRLAEFDRRNPVADNATAEQKQKHDLGALAYAANQARPDAGLIQQARAQAQREIGNESNYFPEDHDGMGYQDYIRARTAEIYSGSSERNIGGITAPRKTRVYDPKTRTIH